MSTIRTTLRRWLTGAENITPKVHFHHRGETAEPCFDERCSLPRL
jgi:hypothetical protein